MQEVSLMVSLVFYIIYKGIVMIYGSDKRDSVLKVDKRICPCCGQDSKYKLKRSDFVFTFFFIPCFPLGSFQTFAECCSCGGRYVSENVSVLNVFPGYDESVGEQPYTVASLFKRTIALVIDIVLLFLFNAGLATFISSHPNLKEWLPNNFIITFATFWFLYFFVVELLTKGYTIGNVLLSVRTSVSYEFKPLTLINNIIRAFVKTLSCIVPVVFIFAFWSRGNREQYMIGQVALLLFEN